jgi:hypothetical protein
MVAVFRKKNKTIKEIFEEIADDNEKRRFDR